MCERQQGRGNGMDAKEKIQSLLEASKDGTVTAAQVSAAGLHRSILQELVVSGELYRFSRGLYVQNNAWEDDFYLLQLKYGRGIYSHDTALYLLGYSDRTPAKYTMTFPKGYNASSLKKEDVVIKRVVPENYYFGQTEIKSPSGNPIRIYDLERTLCDILRGSGNDIQIVGYAMKRYASSKNKDLRKLIVRRTATGKAQSSSLHGSFALSAKPNAAEALFGINGIQRPPQECGGLCYWIIRLLVSSRREF